MEHQYLDSNGLAIIAKHVNARLKTVSEMPAASEKLGVCLYTGETSDGYVKGHIYQSVAEGDAYTWKDVTPLPEAPIVVKGTIAAEDLPDPSGAAVGDMYNISNDFTTTDAFVHSGVFEKAGSNVYCIEIEQGEGDSKTTVKKWDVFAMFITDQSYDAESTSAQSGVAVAQAVADRLHAVKTMPSFAPQGEVIAYIGENTSDYIKGHLYQASTAANSTEWANSNIEQNSQISTGETVWSDGENTYYSSGKYQYIFDRDHNKWIEMHWDGLDSFGTACIWTDRESTYVTLNSGSGDTTTPKKTYVLDKKEHKWTESFDINISYFCAKDVWSDGENTYCSLLSSGGRYTDNYRFSKSTKQWTRIDSWANKYPQSSCLGRFVWTDSKDIYFNMQYVLDKENFALTAVTRPNGSIYGAYVWTDGENIYMSSGKISSNSTQYYFDKENKQWISCPNKWQGLDELMGNSIWIDQNTIHYLYSGKDYMLPLKSSWDDLTIAAAPVKTLSDEDVEAAFA